MRYLLFDTETTGLGSDADVIQFSGLVLDNDLKTVLHCINEYCDTTKIIAPDAYRVHHLDNATVHKLSGGMTLEDKLLKHKQYLTSDDVMFLSYNYDFDSRLVNQTLKNNGAYKFEMPKRQNTFRVEHGKVGYCLMNACASIFGGKRKLNQALHREAVLQSMAARCGEPITAAELDSKIEQMCSSLVNMFGCEQSSGGFHDGLYDTVAAWLVLLTYYPYFN